MGCCAAAVVQVGQEQGLDKEQKYEQGQGKELEFAQEQRYVQGQEQGYTVQE